MSFKFFNIEAAAPKDLEESLNSFLKSEEKKASYIELGISGKQVIVRQFDLPRLNPRELKNHLILEAAELSNLSPREIELDYQIIQFLDTKIKGIFVAMPRNVLRDDFLSKIGKVRFKSMKITAQILTAMDSVLSAIDERLNNFCILHFANGNIINLAVFDQGHCELLRQISYDNLDEAKNEVLHSLKYAWGKSSSKEQEGIYYSGESTGKKQLIADLEKELSLKAQEVNLDGSGTKERSPEADYFRVNLAAKYAVSLSARKKILMVLNIIIVALSAALILSGVRFYRISSEVSALKKELGAKGGVVEIARQIRSLEEKIKSFDDEK
jgi:hypothetical protein